MKKFLQISSSPYNGNFSMRPKEDYIAFPNNIMAEEGYESILATIDIFESSSTKFKLNTLPEVKVYNFTSYLKFFKFVYNYKADIVFGNARTIVGMTAFLFGKRSIFMNHTANLPKKWWQRILLRFCLKRFDCIKCDSIGEKIDLIRLGIYGEHVCIIPIPVDYEFFSEQMDKDIIRKEYGIKKNDFVIVFLAALRELKSPDTVLEAVKILKGKGIQVKLFQVGEDLVNFSQRVKKLGLEKRVISTGWLDSYGVRDILQISDVGVQMSISEGQCLSVCEYIAAGLPICVSDIPSFDHWRALKSDYNNSYHLAKNIEYCYYNRMINKGYFIDKNMEIIKADYDYNKNKIKMKKMIIGEK